MATYINSNLKKIKHSSFLLFYCGLLFSRYLNVLKHFNYCGTPKYFKGSATLKPHNENFVFCLLFHINPHLCCFNSFMTVTSTSLSRIPGVFGRGQYHFMYTFIQQNEEEVLAKFISKSQAQLDFGAQR